MDVANPTFEEMARHWFHTFGTNPNVESFSRSRSWFWVAGGWIASLLIIWGQRLICHHECLALLLYFVEGHSFFLLQRHFMYQV
jgi:hypothetical protein